MTLWGFYCEGHICSLLVQYCLSEADWCSSPVAAGRAAGLLPTSTQATAGISFLSSGFIWKYNVFHPSQLYSQHSCLCRTCRLHPRKERAVWKKITSFAALWWSNGLLFNSNYNAITVSWYVGMNVVNYVWVFTNAYNLFVHTGSSVKEYGQVQRQVTSLACFIYYFWNLIYFSSSILLCSSYNAIISLLLYRFQFFLLLCYYVLKGIIQIKLKSLKGEKAQLFFNSLYLVNYTKMFFLSKYWNKH